MNRVYLLHQSNCIHDYRKECQATPETVLLTVSNTKEEISNLPDTGSNEIQLQTLSAIVVLSGFLLLIVSRKKKEN